MWSGSRLNSHCTARRRKQYELDKAKVFNHILGQCTDAVRNRIENANDFEQLEVDSNIVEILKRLKVMAFSSGGTQDPFWMLSEVVSQLAGVRQGQHESLTNYLKRYEAQVDVVEGGWGKLYPTALVDTNTTKEQARDKFLARLFLHGSHCEDVKTEMKNNYLVGKDQYPGTVHDMYTYISDYLTNKGIKQIKISPEPASGGATSFNQVTQNRRKPCWHCGEEGHVRANCPQRQQQEDVTPSNVPQQQQQQRVSIWSGSGFAG